jgi:urate oxidase
MDMSWNYRVMKQVFDGDDFLQIHEVYYDKKNKKSWTVNGVTVAGESIEELRDVLNKMLEALDKEILDYED